ncbi:MAG TPA: hypothetical protein PK956_07935 [Burkholderiaceae bacterium]|jgi:hypothetical protein|nr:hypothetical protein [Burkholderiaceae bacterium]HRA78715.1 hypothetical protein [Burkholderiaceae bacterium]
MILVRVFVIVVLAAVVWCAAGYLFTRDRKYLRVAVRVLAVGAVGALVFFAVMFAQRL